MKNKLIIISKVLGIFGSILSSASFLQHLNPAMSYESAMLYMLTVGVGISAIIGTIRLKKKKFLIWGFWLLGWGLITATYTTYHGILLSCVKIAPLSIYCLWIVYYLEQNSSTTSADEFAVGANNPVKARYARLFFISYVAAVSSLPILIIYFALFNDAIPKVYRGEALLGIIKSLLVLVPFSLGFIAYNYIFKKIHDLAIWLWVSLTVASFAIVPAILGFGWIYGSLVGIPWGNMVYYGCKMEQERWKEKQLHSRQHGDGSLDT